MRTSALLVFVGAACASCDNLAEAPVAGSLLDDLGMLPPASSTSSAELSAPPARQGNRVRLLYNGEAAFEARMQLLEEAQRSIYVQALIFKADQTGRALGDALIARKRATPELDIRVIVDAYSNVQDAKAQLMYFELKNAGIEVEGFETLYLHWLNEINLADWLAGNKRYHEKYFVTDGSRAVVGGMNIGDEYARCSADPIMRWRDQDVYLEGAVARDVELAFLDNYAQFKGVKDAKPTLFNTDAYWKLWLELNPGMDELLQQSLDAGRAVKERLPWSEHAVCVGQPLPSEVHEDVAVRFIRNRPRLGERHIPQLYLDLIGAAQRSVLVENAYFVPNPDLRAALIAAAQRGAAVQVVTNSAETNDIPMITQAGRAHYLELLDGGVQVFEWHGERHGEGTLHAKLAVFDERVAIVGSYNLDPRSEGLNSEDVVVITDPAVASELARFGRDKDLPMAEAISRIDALRWADPMSLPQPPEKLPLWSDPRFDRKAFEFMLLRQIEGSL